MTSLADKLRAIADRIDPETDGVVILIVLLAHSLLVQALLVHLIRQTSLLFLILVVGRTVPGIEVTEPVAASR